MVEIKVREGDTIQKGQPLFVSEALKMESTINAPASGTVDKIHLPVNTIAEQDDCLLTMK